MSGVNAHAVFATPPHPAASGLRREHAYLTHRDRVWAVPPVNQLVQRAHAGDIAACIFAIDARSAETAYLAEHQVWYHKPVLNVLNVAVNHVFIQTCAASRE